MKKKLLSLFMACAMILALAVPAFAATYNVNPEDGASEDLTQTVTIATRTFIPTVALTLPTMTEPSVVLNPYKITFAGEEAVVNGQEVKDDSSTQNPDQEKQVISPVYFIKNQTNVKLNYTVAVTGSLEGDVTFSQEPVSLTESKKKAHIALMVANKGITVSNNGDPSIATTVEQKITNVTGLTAADIETQWLKTSEVKFTQPKSLDAITSSNGANYVAFQFKGDLTRQPTPNSWKAEDKVGAVITFTFTPESAQDYANTTAVALTYAQTTSGAATTADLAVTTNKTDWDGIMTAAGIAAADVNTTPEWKVEKEGLYGAKVFTASGATTSSGITFSATELNKVTAATGGTAYDDTVILSFKDVDGVPRTVALKVTITVSP